MRNIRQRILSIVALLAIAITLFTVAAAAHAKAANLNGVWTADDGANYYLRQIGNTLWWYGENDKDNPSYSNVAHGTISGTTINLQWADVPKGNNNNNGLMQLNIDNDNQLRRVSGEFGPSTWTR